MSNSKKYEVWPVAIIASFILFGGFVFYAIYQAAKQPAPLVTEDYYAREIAFQGQIDKQKMVKMLGKDVQVRLDREAGKLFLEFPLDTFPSTLTQGEITLYRASDQKMDMAIGLQPNEKGEQQIELKGLAPGYWKVLIDWKEGGISFYQEEEIII
ncbi:MAG: FixH family protein [Bacteroidia bacterium]|nr:FixH family protein [Bacteroidia bacterium]